MKKNIEECMTKLENDLKDDGFRSSIFSRFIVVWTLMTRFPVPQKWWPKDFIPGHLALVLAPAVGAVLGLLTGVVFAFLTFCGLPQLPAAWISIFFYAISGWTIHLDGWGDLWDGMGSGKSGEELREIMKDSRLGSFGAVGLILAFGCWTSLVSQLPADRVVAALIVSGAMSRFAICTVAYYGTYPWEKGLAKGWVEEFTDYDWFSSFIVALLVMPFAPLRWLMALLFIYGAARLTAKRMTVRLGGVNGDVLGATEVLCEIITLAVFFI